MICLDIDGTLLNSSHQISENTKRAVQIITKEKQIPVILVSARMPKGIFFLQKELKISQPIICYSGALVVDKDSSILLNKSIPSSMLQQIYTCARKLDIHISLYREDTWYIEKSDEWSEQESEITHIKPAISKFHDLLNMWENQKSGANKVLCMGSPDSIKLLEKELKSFSEQDLNIYPSKPTYLEIMPKAASKTSAIKFLLEKFSLTSDQIIAMGDNFNDADMLEYAGLGIAMGNAPNQVKQLADAVTCSNDEDGVAEAIYRYILAC